MFSNDPRVVDATQKNPLYDSIRERYRDLRLLSEDMLDELIRDIDSLSQDVQTTTHIFVSPGPIVFKIERARVCARYNQLVSIRKRSACMDWQFYERLKLDQTVLTFDGGSLNITIPYDVFHEVWTTPLDDQYVGLTRYESLDRVCCTDWSKLTPDGEYYGGYWRAPEGSDEKINAYALTRTDSLQRLCALPYSTRLIVNVIMMLCRHRTECVVTVQQVCEHFTCCALKLQKRAKFTMCVHTQQVLMTTILCLRKKVPLKEVRDHIMSYIIPGVVPCTQCL